MLGGTQLVVPALPHGCCFGEGMRCGPGRAGAWEGVCASGVGAHRAGGAPGGVWGDVQAHAGPSACTPARVCRARCTKACVHVCLRVCRAHHCNAEPGAVGAWGGDTTPGLGSGVPAHVPAAHGLSKLGWELVLVSFARGGSRSSQEAGVGQGRGMEKMGFFAMEIFTMEIFVKTRN